MVVAERDEVDEFSISDLTVTVQIYFFNEVLLVLFREVYVTGIHVDDVEQAWQRGPERGCGNEHDAVRVWRHKAGHGALGAPLRAAVVDRVIGHVAHLVVTLVGLMLWPWAHGRAAPLWAWLVVVGILAVVVVIALRPLAGLRSLVADAKMALSRPRQWGVHTLLSTALLASILFGFYAAARALGLPLGWGVLTAVPLMILVLVLPVSVGGWGIREVASVLVFSLLGWSATDAVAVSAAYGMSCLVGALPAVVFWFKPREVE